MQMRAKRWVEFGGGARRDPRGGNRMMSLTRGLGGRPARTHRRGEDVARLRVGSRLHGSRLALRSSLARVPRRSARLAFARRAGLGLWAGSVRRLSRKRIWPTWQRVKQFLVFFRTKYTHTVRTYKYCYSYKLDRRYRTILLVRCMDLFK